MLKGRQNIAIVGFTTDGDVFGGFHSVAVTKQEERFHDPTMFAYSFESHGRCATPQLFVVKKGLKDDVYAQLWKNDNNGFVNF